MNRIAMIVLITGQILKGISLVRAPVNRLKTENISSIAAEERYTILFVVCCEPVNAVISRTSTPMKQKISPSTSHSMVRISRLSRESSPKPFTTGFRANRWAIPHNRIRIDPVYKNIDWAMFFPFYLIKWWNYNLMICPNVWSNFLKPSFSIWLTIRKNSIKKHFFCTEICLHAGWNWVWFFISKINI